MQLLFIAVGPLAPDGLSARLSDFGFVVRKEHGLERVIGNRTNADVSAIVIDSGNAQGLGAQFVRRLRDSGFAQPIAVLCAQSDWRDRVDCLDAGADDYMVKPVRVEEIDARLRAIIRRASGNAADLISAHGIEIDLKSRAATMNGQELALTRNEFRLLRLFLLEPGRSLSSEEIRRSLYTGRNQRSCNAVEVHIARLRRKIGRERIRTIRGVGYRLGEFGDTCCEDAQSQHVS